MIISYSRRFIFIHVYRVAGNSLMEALKPFAHDPERFINVPLLRRLLKRQIELHRELSGRNYGHITAKELKAELPARVFDNFYKFTFVRNPWDLQVSIYHFVLQYTNHPRHEFFKTFGSFEKFLEWRLVNMKDLQKEFVVGESGELLVDFVGRYEAIARDFQTVCQRIGIPYLLPHKNSSSHKDFRQYYTPETRAMVAEAYKEDIDYFGYTFDEQENLPPILGPGEAERLPESRQAAAAGKLE